MTVHGNDAAAAAAASSGQAKRHAAEQAALLPDDGMTVGLGTGSTVAFLLPALARRSIRARYVATSPATEQAALALGLDVVAFDGIDRLDLTIDGADQLTPDHWLVKGGGGAHVREKIVARASDRLCVIVSDDKLVSDVVAPVPLELLAFGLDATLRSLGNARIREGWPTSPDGGLIADWWGPVGDPSELAAKLSDHPGVVDHGLFPPGLVSEVIVGSASTNHAADRE